MSARLLPILPLALVLFACDQKVSIDTQEEKLSYTVGTRVAQGLKRDSIEIDAAAFVQAIKDVQSGSELALKPEEMREVMQVHQKTLLEERKAAAERNKTEGEAFLAENKNKEGIVTLESGLQYKVIKEGTGATPKPTDSVVAHYRGTLIDGKEFDSSHKRGQPATFPVRGVIKGWQEALQKMKAGAQWQIFVPSELGYGARGAGADIGPNAALIFDIELLEIKEPAKASSEPAPKHN